MHNALIYSPGLDGHRQVYVFVLANILEELNFNIYIACNVYQKVFNSFYFDKLKTKLGITIIDTGKYSEGGLKITHSQFLELQNQLCVDLTILPEADHHLELLTSQLPKKKNSLRGKLVGIFLRPFYYYHNMGLLGKLRYVKHLPSRWKTDERLFHELLLDRFALLDKALYIDENYVQYHHKRVWIPDMFQQYADMVGHYETADQRIWIERLNEFKSKNSDRFLFLYFGTAQYRRGYDVLLKIAEDFDGCFIHCGLRNKNENFALEIDSIRDSLDKKGQLFETNQFIEDPICIEAFFRSVSHLILPYRNFFGSSGVMLQALSYGIPVLAPEAGLIGHRIRKYNLGVTFNEKNPNSLLTQCGGFIQTDPRDFEISIQRYMHFQTAENLKECLVRVFSNTGAFLDHP